MKRIIALFTLLFLAFQNQGNAQGSDEYGKGLVIKFSDDGSKYMRFITWHQVWLHRTENNNLSKRFAGDKDQLGISSDFEVRRSRFLWYAQINKRYLVLSHFGINNQTTFNGGVSAATDPKKPQLFMHDLWNEYKIYNSPKFSLDLGAGLMYWHGVSRMASASTINFLAIDAPIFNWANIETSDQFARYMGMYVKGKVSKLDYRLNLAQPFTVNTANGLANSEVASYNPYNKDFQYAGYFSWDFFESESNLLPFKVGTYLGTKKVFNIGAGFQTAKNQMWYKAQDGDTLETDQTLLGFDSFLDLPINKEKGTALTVYALHQIMNFGPNYVRAIGIMNPALASAGTGSYVTYRGNAVPLIGTGNISYAQAGFLFPKKWFKGKVRLQPYAAGSYALFNGLKNANNEIVPVTILDSGLNAYIDGHQAKITFNYRNRPDFTEINNIKRRGEYCIQFQVCL
jgi:hypothetical protein